jgi:predicted nucleotidyltransferase
MWVYFHYMKPTFTAGDLFGSKGRIDVLRILWGVAVPLTAAEVARRARMTHPAVTTILRSLTRQGLVGSSPAGRGHTYWMLKDNAYVQRFLDPVFSSERDLPDVMLDELCREIEPSAVSVVLFGSYARGDQTADSDVDVAVVTADESAKEGLAGMLVTFGERFERRFGARLSPLVYDRKEAAQLADRSPSLWHSLKNDGVTVSGLGVDEWQR